MSDITRGIRPEINRAVLEALMKERERIGASLRGTVKRKRVREAAHQYIDQLVRAISAVARAWDTRKHKGE